MRQATRIANELSRQLSACGIDTAVTNRTLRSRDEFRNVSNVPCVYLDISTKRGTSYFQFGYLGEPSRALACACAGSIWLHSHSASTLRAHSTQSFYNASTLHFTPLFVHFPSLDCSPLAHLDLPSHLHSLCSTLAAWLCPSPSRSNYSLPALIAAGDSLYHINSITPSSGGDAL